MTGLNIEIAGHPDQAENMLADMANRHGLIAGATGTGKTVTLQVMAEQFSQIGVPVFMADVKGDLSGLATPGKVNEKIHNRLDQLAIKNYSNRAFPVVLWDLYGKRGHAMRTTISDMGPLLLSSLMQLNETQTGVLYAAFRFADDQGLLLLDMKDLRALLAWISDQRKELSKLYGNLAPSSIAAIQRRLLMLEEQGAEQFLGEPAVSLSDLMQTDFSGNGVISVLDATQLMTEPRLYAMFLLWLIAELFEQLPEVGDPEKPKLVFFFDEAHLLFDDANDTLIDKIEQVVRLIRSKGVGIYFITQNPGDLPDSVLGQLGNRVQHALRAFTPRDQKAVKTAAQTFRQNEGLDTEKVITELGVGEALVSFLDEKGRPRPVQRALIHPPQSRIGPLSDEERRAHMERSPFKGRYDQVLDRHSAYEMLQERAEQAAREAGEAETEKAETGAGGRGRQRQSVFEAFAKSAMRSVGSQIGRQIARGLLGSLFGKR
jgi:DNA helicase HerA-like ATPase